MIFAGINYVAVLAAAICGFLTGAVYYSLLAKQWMAAAGLTEADIKGPDGGGKPAPTPFIVAAVCQLLMAVMLAGVIGHLGDDAVTVRNGVISAAFIWLGFVVSTQAVNYSFQMKKPMLIVIDGAHWLAVLLVQGIVIGLIGV